MLSHEISTKLSGRYVEIGILPLSFREFLQFRSSYGPEASIDEKFSEYIRWGGLPATALMSGVRRDLVSMMISSTYDTVFVKDVIERNRIRNPLVMSNVSRFMMKNIGDRTSPRNASGYLVSKGIKASVDTVDSYIGFLENAGLFIRARRMDSRTREYLQTSDKFYVTDLGMRNEAIGYSDRDIDGVLENIVFMELLYRYGNASVMNVDGKEIDFVSFDENGDPMYYQVSVSILVAETMKRELAPLRAIEDNYPKTVVTLDRYPYDNIDGIHVANVIDFLNGKDERSPEKSIRSSEGRWRNSIHPWYRSDRCTESPVPYGCSEDVRDHIGIRGPVRSISRKTLVEPSRTRTIRVDKQWMRSSPSCSCHPPVVIPIPDAIRYPGGLSNSLEIIEDGTVPRRYRSSAPDSGTIHQRSIVELSVSIIQLEINYTSV